MKPGRLVSFALAAAAAFALLAVPAAGHHPLEQELAESEATLRFSEERGSVFMEALAENPPLAGIGQNMEIVANVPMAQARYPEARTTPTSRLMHRTSSSPATTPTSARTRRGWSS
jgi:hypothetical protein